MHEYALDSYYIRVRMNGDSSMIDTKIERKIFKQINSYMQVIKLVKIFDRDGKINIQ